MEVGIKELQTADDPLLVSSIISVIAIGKGQPALGWIAVRYPEDERRLILASYWGLE